MAGFKSISRKRHVRPAVPAPGTHRKHSTPSVLDGESLHQKSSNTLACVETCWFALRSMDHIAEVGTICMSLGHAVAALRETHDAVEVFIDSVKP